MLTDKNLKNLAERISRRDIKAFHELYIKCMPALHAFAYRFTYNSDTAKDIVHDAFITLWDNAKEIDTQKNILHFLRTMVRNNCLNHLRQLRIRDQHSDKLTEALLLSSGEKVWDELDDEEQAIRKKLQDIMSLLPEKAHEILLLHIVHGMKIKQIATQFGVAESTVKTHIKRAMRILRENLPSFFFPFF